MTPRKGRTRVRRRGAVLRALAVAAAVVPFAAGASAPQERTWNGKHNIEAIRLEDVADEDRPPGVGGTKQGADARADEGEKPDDERREAVEFGAALSRLWDSIPAYSPVNAQSRLTSGFGWRAGPLSGRREFHGGVDLAAAQDASDQAVGAAGPTRGEAAGRALEGGAAGRACLLYTSPSPRD